MSTADCTAAASSTPQKSPTGTPALRKCCFCSSLSCIQARAHVRYQQVNCPQQWDATQKGKAASGRFCVQSLPDGSLTAITMLSSTSWCREQQQGVSVLGLTTGMQLPANAEKGWDNSNSAFASAAQQHISTLSICLAQQRPFHDSMIPSSCLFSGLVCSTATYICSDKPVPGGSLPCLLRAQACRSHLYESQGCWCRFHVHVKAVRHILQRIGVNVLYLHCEDVNPLCKAPTQDKSFSP